MQRFFSVLVAGALCLSVFVGCEKQSYQDGTYSAEFAGYDSRGYKDQLTVVVEDGVVVDIQYDAVNQESGKKSEDEAYKADMDATQNNFPSQVHSALENQYLVAQDIDKVDVVAGATYSTNCFLALFKALEDNMYKGDANPVVVENIPER